ncbi:MAG: class I SAM-dependent methyltransferase [Clostridia bacterium]|nr:class I SAM-dependent methyltransferase [Clostridia bacterium]
MEKKENFSDYWNNNYTKYYERKIAYDNWLEKYDDLINACDTTILDLGCGAGNDTLYLTEKGKDVLSCDYSKVALEKLEKNIENSKTMLFNISNLPYNFESESFKIIIADLSLHYFYEKTTFDIMNELKRILTKNGTLLARVNSVNDSHYGAGKGEKLEHNYYYVTGYNKRFFDETDIEKFFSVIGDVTYSEKVISRFGNNKKLFEIKVTKKD